ncbi:MAG: hypothetical protein LAT75_12065 [Candidatus Cyclonatronum sp.]|uniref:hypothetical protein n=1 Tax=Cyclonatronum sp. TaxID=3024185 RepID=UPI0025C63499|nr:hypothetical protein [Cyclonatronum sp.]MCH8487594.1 hypothetical protein [Cyclonatronum sp.]
MNTTDTNTKLINSYLSLIKNMSVSNKLDLISKLSSSMKADFDDAKVDFYDAFGAWDEEESAEALVDAIKSTRTFMRKTEEF